MFQLLEVTGDHQDLGHAIGTTFGKEIRERIAQRRVKITDYQLYLDQTQPYFDFTKRHLPKLMVETEAIAEAAGVPLKELFFMNCREVYNFFFDEDEFTAVERKVFGEPDRCTIAVVFDENGPIVGHNEDWDIRAIDELYLLKANIDGTEIFGLANKVLIPGDVATVNSHGLVQCINEIHITHQPGIPKNYLARAVLECKTLNEAENLLRKLPRASGFNHVLVQGGEVRNIEIVGDLMDVSFCRGIPFGHSNHLLSERLREHERARTESSVARYERLQTLLPQTHDVPGMMRLLADHGNAELPICRHGETMGSLVFLPQQRKVWISRGQPCKGDFREWSY